MAQIYTINGRRVPVARVSKVATHDLAHYRDAISKEQARSILLVSTEERQDALQEGLTYLVLPLGSWMMAYLMLNVGGKFGLIGAGILTLLAGACAVSAYKCFSD